jgi:hypothetical protein
MRWVREHALMFGVLLGVGGGLLLVVLMVYELPLVEFVLGRNTHWVQFIAYTVVIFVVLVNRCRPQSGQTKYWTVLAALLLLHSVGYVWFISRIKPLGAIQYIVAAPFEIMLLYFLLDRGTRFLAGRASTFDVN